MNATGTIQEQDEGLYDEETEGQEAQGQSSQASEIAQLRAELAIIKKEREADLLEKRRAEEEEDQTEASQRRLELEDESFLPEEYSGLDEEGLAELLSDPTKFLALVNTLGNSVYKKSIGKGHEITMQVLPDVITPIANRQMTSRSMVQKFYDDNEDLRGHGKFIQYMYNELDTPDRTPEQVFEMLGPAVRAALGIQKGQSSRHTLPSGSNVMRNGNPSTAKSEQEKLDEEIKKVFGI